MSERGAIACGHPETARAAAQVLSEGGNAFDAALAGLCTACVAEPVLASLAGGGFLTARPASGPARVFDFFTQTPKRPLPAADVDFRPITADFGTAQQEFHIGLGAVATPGVAKGLFEVHADLGRMPLRDLVQPALRLAREGVLLNGLQAYIFGVVAPIYRGVAVFASPREDGALIREGERFAWPEYGDTLDALVHEGADLMYRGEIGRALVDACASGGGHLTMADLEGYRVERRPPLALDWGDGRVLTNPPPSTGGILVAFGLELLRHAGLAEDGFASPAHLEKLAAAMATTQRARLAESPDRLLDPELLARYRMDVLGHPPATRGTTQISVIDRDGNAAALTVSNGEGSGVIIPGTGIMANNMLGEEDINPQGLDAWPADVRQASMMAPSLVLRPDGRVLALGSGGSKRIRTAMLQVLVDLLAFGMPPDAAVEAPRMHVENDCLSLEPGFPEESVAALAGAFDEIHRWDDRNLFFGGVHTVLFDEPAGRFEGAGDPRRGGAVMTV